jgi:hypothetical protein
VKTWCERWNIKINEGISQAIYFSRRLISLDNLLQLIGREVPFVNNVCYLGITFNKRIIRKQHIEMSVARALSTYIRNYSVFKCEPLTSNIKLMLSKALMGSVMTCLSHMGICDGRSPFEMQRLQNRVLCAVGYLDRCTPVRELHVACKIPYMYDYINKLCRTKTEVILNHANPNVRSTGKGEARHRKYKRLKHGGGQAYDRSAD